MRAIFFDFGGTLDGDGIPWLERFYPLYRRAGLKTERPAFAKAFYAADDALPSAHSLEGASLEDTVRLQVEEVLGRIPQEDWPQEGAARESVLGEVSGRFMEECRAHFERMRPVLSRLARKYRLGVISNFYGNLESVLASEGLLKYFSSVEDSGAVGLKKPEPSIFRKALDAVRGSVEESLMVGDSLERDMKGAEGVGMRHAWVGARNPLCCAAVLPLRSAADIEAFL